MARMEFKYTRIKWRLKGTHVMSFGKKTKWLRSGCEVVANWLRSGCELVGNVVGNVVGNPFNPKAFHSGVNRKCRK